MQEDISNKVWHVLNDLHNSVTARAGVVLYPNSNDPYLTGLKTKEVRIDLDELSKAISELLKHAKPFLEKYLKDEELKMLYISTKERQVYLRLFSALDKQNRKANLYNENENTWVPELIPAVLGITKDGAGVDETASIQKFEKLQDEKTAHLVTSVEAFLGKIHIGHKEPRTIHFSTQSYRVCLRVEHKGGTTVVLGRKEKNTETENRGKEPDKKKPEWTFYKIEEGVARIQKVFYGYGATIHSKMLKKLVKENQSKPANLVLKLTALAEIYGDKELEELLKEKNGLAEKLVGLVIKRESEERKERFSVG